jgi:hypothetical protein
MRVIIFCALAVVVGCGDGAAPEAFGTGGSGGQAVTSTGGVGGATMMMTATGGVAGGTGGAAGAPMTVDAGAVDAQPDHPGQQQCPSGYTNCGYRGPTQPGSCTNLQTDPQNCGACDHICPGPFGTLCQGGVCQ